MCLETYTALFLTLKIKWHISWLTVYWINTYVIWSIIYLTSLLIHVYILIIKYLSTTRCLLYKARYYLFNNGIHIFRWLKKYIKKFCTVINKYLLSIKFSNYIYKMFIYKMRITWKVLFFILLSYMIFYYFQLFQKGKKIKDRFQRNNSK